MTRIAETKRSGRINAESPIRKKIHLPAPVRRKRLKPKSGEEVGHKDPNT